jgi:hypothetical protein
MRYSVTALVHLLTTRTLLSNGSACYKKFSDNYSVNVNSCYTPIKESRNVVTWKYLTVTGYRIQISLNELIY